MSEATKDTIYIDVDDEITSIIDKVKGSNHKLIALVLPKRASVLQSVVNMKLLKKASDDAKKNLVLITSETSLLPLAGSVGLYVAKTLQSKPIQPDAPGDEMGEEDGEPVSVDSGPDEFDPSEAAEKPIGDLAGLPTSPSSAEPSNLMPDETIDLNEDELAATATISDAIEEKKKNKKAKKDKKDKKLRVPNFVKFRRWLLIGGVILIALIVALVYLGKVLPKAVVTIQTNNTTVATNLSLNLSTNTQTLDSSSLTVPATSQSVKKANSQQVPTTGQQNNGQKATGQVTLSLTDCSQPQETIPAGTGISASGLTFITQSSVTLTSVQFGNKCNPQAFSDNYSASVNVIAQSGGSQYNIQPNNDFTVAGFSNVIGQSSAAMSGGTDSIINIVAQADINTANSKITAQDPTAEKTILQNDLSQAGLLPIPATFNASSPIITTSPSVGTQADNVTVTQTVTYTMLGVHKSDLQTLVDNSVNSQINPQQQSILDDGISNATYNLVNSSGGVDQVTMQANSTVGTQINVAAIKKQIIGKKSADVQSTIKTYPGVVSVNVHLSPFWVTTVPSNTSKTTITILKQSGS